MRSARRDRVDLLEARPRLPVLRDVGKRERGVTEDAHEHVVEVVRDAAREDGQRVRATALGELGLKGAALHFGPVVADLRDVVNGTAVRVAEEADGEQHRHELPRLRQVTLLHRVGVDLAGEQTLAEREMGVEVVGVRDLLERHLQELLGGIADEVAERPVDLEPAPVERDERHADRRVLERCLELLLRRLQLAFVPCAIGDVVGDREKPEDDAAPAQRDDPDRVLAPVAPEHRLGRLRRAGERLPVELHDIRPVGEQVVEPPSDRVRLLARRVHDPQVGVADEDRRVRQVVEERAQGALPPVDPVVNPRFAAEAAQTGLGGRQLHPLFHRQPPLHGIARSVYAVSGSLSLATFIENCFSLIQP